MTKYGGICSPLIARGDFMQYEISVIVPVYNAEKYVERCLTSIFSQTFKNFECIIVDDCSSDNSIKICEKITECEPRAKIYHRMANQGVGPARNYGLELCCGKYICFVDSDDWIEKDYLQSLYEAVEQNAAEVVQMGYKSYGKNAKKYVFTKETYKISNNLRDRLFKLWILTAPWGKIYKKEYLLKYDIMFPAVPMGEDVLFIFLIMITATKYYVIPDTMYIYRTDNEYSITNGKFPSAVEQYFESLLLTMDSFDRYVKRHPDVIDVKYIDLLHRYLYRYFHYGIKGYMDKFGKDEVKGVLFDRLAKSHSPALFSSLWDIVLDLGVPYV